MHISVSPEVLFHLGPVAITNSILTSWITVALLMIIGITVGATFRRLPGFVQQIFEMAYETFENLAVSVIGDNGKKYVPLVVTFFLLIVASNWLGVLPGVGSLGIWHQNHQELEFTPLFRGANADLNTTLALALISVVVTQVIGIRAQGIGRHLSHFKNPLEIVSEISKVLSFAFRLFGNVFAGEVLLVAAASMISLAVGSTQGWHAIPGGFIQAPFLMLEVFVGFIQGFIFSVLTLSFIGIYVSHQKTHN